MSTEETRVVVRAALSTLLGQELTGDTDDTPLVEIDADRYDSLGVLDCVAEVERRFGISIDLIDDDLVSNFRSVSTISAMVRRKLHDARVLGLYT
jgi:acyl carrier protein